MSYWFFDSCKDMAKRKIIAAHFSLYQRQEGSFYSGIDEWLESIANDRQHRYIDKIWTNQDEISGEMISALTSSQQKRARSDADSVIKSNAEVRRDMMMHYFSIANMLLPNPVTPLISLGLDIDKMVNGDNEVERRQGAEALYGDGINVVLMALSGVLEGRLAITGDEVDWAPKIGTNKKSITSQIRDELQNMHAGQEGTLFTAAKIHNDNLGGNILIGLQIVQSITDLGIQESTIASSQLTSPDEFGVRRGIDGKSYMLINRKVYPIYDIGQKGYYILGDSQKIGIFMNPKLKKYIKVSLSGENSWRNDMAVDLHGSSDMPEKIFQVISPRLRKVLDDFHLQSIPAADIEGKIVFDKANKIFIDRAVNKKYLRVAANIILSRAQMMVISSRQLKMGLMKNSSCVPIFQVKNKAPR